VLGALIRLTQTLAGGELHAALALRFVRSPSRKGASVSGLLELGKSYSQAQRMVMSKHVLPGLTMVTQRLREALSTGHARTLTVFADFANAHKVSSQLSPTRGDDFKISSLPSFYSLIERGRIDLRHPTVLLPSLL
jgi:hypothetical protein